MGKVNAILRPGSISLRIADYFFESTVSAFDSGAKTLADRAFAAFDLGQSQAMCPISPQYRQSPSFLWCSCSTLVSFLSLPNLSEMEFLGNDCWTAENPWIAPAHLESWAALDRDWLEVQRQEKRRSITYDKRRWRQGWNLIRSLKAREGDEG